MATPRFRCTPCGQPRPRAFHLFFRVPKFASGSSKIVVKFCASRICMAFARISVLLSLVTLFSFARPSTAQTQPESNAPQPQTSIAVPAGAMVVYVSDFDLDVVHRKPSQKSTPRTSPPSASRRTPVSRRATTWQWASRPPSSSSALCFCTSWGTRSRRGARACRSRRKGA